MYSITLKPCWITYSKMLCLICLKYYFHVLKSSPRSLTTSLSVQPDGILNITLYSMNVFSGGSNSTVQSWLALWSFICERHQNNTNCPQPQVFVCLCLVAIWASKVLGSNSFKLIWHVVILWKESLSHIHIFLAVFVLIKQKSLYFYLCCV